MTQPKLQRLLKLWQKRLRLLDWNITVEVVSNDAFGLGSTQQGETTTRPTFRDASIKILGEDDAEMELTLVHELVHVVFAGMAPPEGTMEFVFETGVESLARTLIGAFNAE